MKGRIFVVGASLSGTETLRHLVEKLPLNFPAPIFITQHLASHSPEMVASSRQTFQTHQTKTSHRAETPMTSTSPSPLESFVQTAASMFPGAQPEALRVACGRSLEQLQTLTPACKASRNPSRPAGTSRSRSRNARSLPKSYFCASNGSATSGGAGG